jgi:PIN like domain
VPPDPSSLRFYADENILGVGKALAIARRDLIHPGHPLLPDVPLGTLDTDWMPAIAARGLVVLARDRHIRTKPAELAILRTHGLRVFWLAGKRDSTSWGYLVRLVSRWDDVEHIIATRGPGPWFMAIGDATISEISMP